MLFNRLAMVAADVLVVGTCAAAVGRYFNVEPSFDRLDDMPSLQFVAASVWSVGDTISAKAGQVLSQIPGEIGRVASQIANGSQTPDWVPTDGMLGGWVRPKVELDE